MPAPDQHSSEDTVTLSTAYRFFVPLIFMTELNMISKSVINAALARTPDQNVTLAAFHVAFTLYFALSSSTEVCAVLTLGYLKTRRALAPLLRFMICAAWNTMSRGRGSVSIRHTWTSLRR